MNTDFTKHFTKNNLHHAYLIEGTENSVPEMLALLESFGIATMQNPDVSKITVDTFKIEDARNLNSSASLKGFSPGKKIFIISANSFLLEAQNAVLKLFEEPISDTHFFIVLPSIDGLLATFVSRFYVIRNQNKDIPLGEAEKFLTLPLQKRIDFLKELLVESDEENEEEPVLESARSKALRFLNALEAILHKKFVVSSKSNVDFFDHIFKVREFLNQPGSSAKSMMESVALIIPPAVPN